MNHYVYRLCDQDGNYYFGVRSTTKQPERDRYMGSGVWPKECRRGGIELDKTIIRRGFQTRHEAEQHEYRLISSHYHDPQNQNQFLAVPGRGKVGPYQRMMRRIILSELCGQPTEVVSVYMVALGMAQDDMVDLGLVSKMTGIEISECFDHLETISNLNLGGIPRFYHSAGAYFIES
jgi:hypothetical protein